MRGEASGCTQWPCRAWNGRRQGYSWVKKMTLHVVYNHECPDCGAYYIPYGEDVACPRCGLVEEERFDYIPQAAESVRFNLETYGSYVPPAWWVGSLGDHILLILFHLFETYRKEKENRPFGDFATAMLDQMAWGEQEYLKGHVCAIAMEVHETLRRA